MRHYEIVFLVHPDQSEQVTAMTDRYKATITEGGGTVHRYEDWGRRQLAYPINKIHKAHYILMNIECSQEVLDELTNNFKLTPSSDSETDMRKEVEPTTIQLTLIPSLLLLPSDLMNTWSSSTKMEPSQSLETLTDTMLLMELEEMNPHLNSTSLMT